MAAGRGGGVDEVGRLRMAVADPYGVVAEGVGVLAAGPVRLRPVGGRRAGPKTARYLYRPVLDDVLDRVRTMARMCRDHGVRLPQAALQVQLRHTAVRQVVVGMRSPAEVRENLTMPAAPVVLWPLLDQAVR